jgi:hypothetical protein
MPITNNLFGGGLYNQTPSQMDNAYQELMKMRATPYNNYRTVFNDISDE